MRLLVPYLLHKFLAQQIAAFLLLSIFLTQPLLALANNFAPLTISVTTKNTTCGNANGQIHVIASGGTAPYTYAINTLWSQSVGIFNQVSAGTYTVTATDATSTVIATTVTLTNTYTGPTKLTNVSVRPSGCDVRDGSLTLGVIGGTPPYKYSLDQLNFQSSNYFPGLTAGSYYPIAVDANGCSTPNTWLDNVQVYENCPIYQSGQSLSAVCDPFRTFLGLVNVGGGTAPYQYSLDGVTFQASNIFFPTPAGLYTIWIKDATGKIALFSVGVVDRWCFPPFDVTALKVDAHCGNSGQITVIASNGTAPYIYIQSMRHHIRRKMYFHRLPRATIPSG